MLIKKIEVKNWLSHKNSEINFKKGINFIIGQIGAGKSSILEAITFSLYRGKKSKGKQEHYIRRGNTEASTTLTIELEDRTLKIQRFLSKIKSTLKDDRLYENGELISIGAKNVTETLIERIGIDNEEYEYLIYVQQNNLLSIIEESNSKRKEKLDKIMGIEKLLTISKNAKSAANYAFREIEKLSKDLEMKDEEGLKRRLKEKKEELDVLINNLTLKKRRLEELEEKTRTKKEEWEKFERLKEEKERLEKELAKVQAIIQRSKMINLKPLKELLEESKRIENEKKEVEKKLENVELGLREKKMRKDELVSHLSELRQKKKALEEIKNELGKILSELKEINPEELEEKVKKTEEKSNETSQLIGILEGKKKELEERKKNLEKVEGGVCYVCGRPLSEDKRQELLSLLGEKLRRLAQELEEKKKERIHTLELLKKLKRKIEEVRVKEGKVKILENKARELEEEIKGVEELKITELLKKIKEEIENLEKEKEEIARNSERLKEMSKALLKEISEAKLVEKAKEKEKEILERLKKVRFPEEIYEKVRNEYITLKEQLSKIKAEIEGDEKNKKEIEYTLSILEKDLKDIERKKKRMEGYKKAYKELTLIQSYSEALSQELREKYILALNELMSRIWLALYPYQHYKDPKIEVNDDGYLLSISTPRGEKTDVRNLSGGEKTIYALNLKIALSIFLGKTPILILDEPTHNLDEESVKKLSQLFVGEFGKMFDQVIIVTHDERLKEGNPEAHVIRVMREVEKENAPSKVVVG